MKTQKARQQGHDMLTGLAQHACGCASTRRCRVALVGGRAGAPCPNSQRQVIVRGRLQIHKGEAPAGGGAVTRAWAWLSTRPMPTQGCRLALACGRAPQPSPLE